MNQGLFEVPDEENNRQITADVIDYTEKNQLALELVLI